MSNIFLQTITIQNKYKKLLVENMLEKV